MPSRVAAVLCLMLLALPARARPTTLPTTLPAETPPTAEVRIPGQVYAYPFGFSADGRTAYFIGRVRHVPVWAMVTSYWPEVVGTVWVLLAARAFLRVRRRRQDPAHEYCRDCNYSLHKLTSDTCPECGLALTRGNRVRGRRRRGRLVALAVLAAAPLLAYGLARHRLPRTGPWTRWFEWSSPRLAEYAAGGGGRRWLLRHVVNDQRVIAVDTATGGIARQWRIDIPAPATFGLSVAISDDERFLFVPRLDDGKGTQDAAQFDLASGRLVRRLPASSPSGSLVVDGRRGIVYGLDLGTVVAWDVGTGQRLGERPLIRFARNGFSDRIWWARLGERLLFYRFGGPAADPELEHAVYDWDPRTEASGPIAQFSATHWWTDGTGAAHAVRTDPTTGAQSAGRIDPGGRAIESIPLPPLPAAGLRWRGAGRWLYVQQAAPAPGVLLVNLDDPAVPHWIGIPGLARVQLSPDGRTLLAVVGPGAQQSFRLYALPPPR